MTDAGQGREPSTQDIVELRNTLLQSNDLRRVSDLEKQLKDQGNLSEDAGRSLVALLQVGEHAAACCLPPFWTHAVWHCTVCKLCGARVYSVQHVCCQLACSMLTVHSTMLVQVTRLCNTNLEAAICEPCK